jgi:hypothetical protein
MSLFRLVYTFNLFNFSYEYFMKDIKMKVYVTCESLLHVCDILVRKSSEIYCRIVKSMSTDVFEVRAASITRVMSEPSAKR